MNIIKNIVILSMEFPPILGGAGSVSFTLAEELSKENNIEVITYSNIKSSKYKVFSVEKKYKNPILRYYYIYIRIKKSLRNADCIIIGDFAGSVLASFCFNKKLYKKSFLYLHGSEPEIIYKGNNIFFKLVRFKRKYEKMILNIKGIIAVSEFMKSKFLYISQLYSVKDKITVIYTGINSKSFKRCEDNLIRKQLKITQEDTILLSVSRIHYDKGYKNMLKIFKDACKYNENLKWVIIGEGPYFKVLEKDIKENNLNSKVFLLGKIPREELNKYYSMCDCFWLLSEFKESFGLVYVEANMCGAPVIARGGSGVNECVYNGENGYIINDNKECLDIINKKEYLNVKNVNFVSDKLTLRKMINEISELINDN